MTFEKSRVVILGLIAVSIAILIPGLIAPVLTIRGVLTRDGITSVAPMLIEKGLNEDTVNSLKSMMNPAMVGLLQATGGDLRKMITGETGARRLAIKGRLRAVGDIGLGLKLPDMFAF